MGRPAAGVRGIRLYEGDEVVSMAMVTQDSKLLTVTENGLRQGLRHRQVRGARG